MWPGIPRARSLLTAHDSIHRTRERVPRGALACELRASRPRDAVVLARRTTVRFHEVCLHQSFRMQAAHEWIDRPLAHPDGHGQAARDVVGVAVFLREQLEYTQFEHALLELDVDGFCHGSCRNLIKHGTCQCKVVAV